MVLASVVVVVEVEVGEEEAQENEPGNRGDLL
jgi:hypothetical protein